MAVRVQIKNKDAEKTIANKTEDSEYSTNNQFDGLAALVLDATHLVGQAAAQAVPVITTTDSSGKLEQIPLYQGKTALIEQTYLERIDKALSTLEIKDIKTLAQSIGESLKKAPEQDTELQYVYKTAPKGQKLRHALVYTLANIVRTAVQQRKLDLGTAIPYNLKIADVVDGKLTPNTDFSNLAGPYKLGKDTSDKEITYTPDYPLLLKQLRWLTFDSDDKFAKIDYNFLQVKRFSNATHQVVSNYSSPEYSFILSVNEQDYKKLSTTENYKEFFDELYKYTVFYKPAVDPSEANKLRKPPRSPVMNSFGDVFSSLTETEKDELLTALYKRRNKMTEQAFGGSGCLEFALKSVQTFDDLYKNIMHKANWSLFIAQVIDRFKCELSKLGGGDLACLADFDVMGTYQNSLQAIDVIENFPDLYEARLKEQPLAPVMQLIYNRSIPSMPSIDWYKCLRAFLLGLILKIMTELIVGFVQMILASLNVQCDADFSSCEQSDLDPNSDDINTIIKRAPPLLLV